MTSIMPKPEAGPSWRLPEKPLKPPTPALPPPGVASVAALSGHLRASEVVQVRDQDGTSWGFEIRSVGTPLLDPEGAWYAQLLAKDPEGFKAKVLEVVGAPSPAVLRGVLLQGTLNPVLSAAKADGNSVWIEDLLRRDFLARGLYAEIMRVTLKGLFQVTVQATEEASGEPRPTP